MRLELDLPASADYKSEALSSAPCHPITGVYNPFSCKYINLKQWKTNCIEKSKKVCATCLEIKPLISKHELFSFYYVNPAGLLMD